MTPSTQPIQDFDGEEWRNIEGWVGYEVSNFGRVKSWWIRTQRSPAVHEYRDTPRLVGGHVGIKGQISVGLTKVLEPLGTKGRLRTLTVQNLVLAAFVGPRPEGMVSVHLDDDLNNNHVSNLRWITYKQQIMRTLHAGKNSKIEVQDVPDIWRRIVAGESNNSIARLKKVSSGAVASIKSGKNWSHITSTLPGWPLIRVTDHHGKEPIYCESDIIKSTEEIWRELPNFPGYRVSSWGNAQSCWWYNGWKDERKIMPGEWHEVVLSMSPSGYKHFNIKSDTEIKQARLHVLILEVFACPRPLGYVGCHNNGNKLDNHVSNLRWDSIRANNLDIQKHKRERILKS